MAYGVRALRSRSCRSSRRTGKPSTGDIPRAKGSRLPWQAGVRVGEMPRACTHCAQGTGEPDDAKVSCPVRRGTGRKGSNDLARGLPYLRSRFWQPLQPGVGLSRKPEVQSMTESSQ